MSQSDSDINSEDRARPIKVVLLVGSRDFGRCPIASAGPVALWPVFGEPCLQRVLRMLAQQGVSEIVVCSDDDISLIEGHVLPPEGVVVHFQGENLPLGTAGCVHQAVGNDTDSIWVAMRAAMVQPPDVKALVELHTKNEADLTLMLSASDEHSIGSELAGIYVFDPKVTDHIPRGGYFDFKEGLIPAAVRAGCVVCTARMPRAVGGYGEWVEYIRALATYMSICENWHQTLPDQQGGFKEQVWRSDKAAISESVRIYGPVAVMPGATIHDDAVIFGPTIIGRNVLIDRGAFIENSVIWPDAEIGAGCEIRSCLIDDYTIVPEKSSIEGQTVCDRDKAVEHHSPIFSPSISRLISPTAGDMRDDKHQQGYRKTLIRQSLVVFGILVVALIWAYWPVLSKIARIWRTSEEYSAGAIVPLLAVGLLWARRKNLHGVVIRPSLLGAVAFILSIGMMAFGVFYMYGSAERLSFIMALASLVLLVFGRSVFRRVRSILFFLFLMLPFPQSVHESILVPAQRFSINAAVFCLQSLGMFAAQDGTVLNVGQKSLIVGAGCSGLRLVTAFMVVAAVVAILSSRSRWEKVLVFASSIPIAILCNALRVTVTAAAYGAMSNDWQWQTYFHDAAGFAMMPVALAIIVLELWLLSKLMPVERSISARRRISTVWEST